MVTKYHKNRLMNPGLSASLRKTQLLLPQTLCTVHQTSDNILNKIYVIKMYKIFVHFNALIYVVLLFKLVLSNHFKLQQAF